MPRTRVVFFQDAHGRVPVRDWLAALRHADARAFAKCVARIRRLAELGHALRRPEVDYLASGVYELRVRRGHIQYRLLYFFHGSARAVLVHAITKEDAVSRAELRRAMRRRAAFVADPEGHTYGEDT